MKIKYSELIDQTLYFPTEEFSVAENQLQFHGIPLMDVVEQFGTPLKFNYLPKISMNIQRAKAWFKEAFEKKYWEDLFYKKENGKYQLNLWKANELIFLESGILPEHMAITNVCTHCNSKILYSHRTMGNNRGNLCAFLALK